MSRNTEEGKKELLRVKVKSGVPLKVKKEEEGLMSLYLVAELLEATKSLGEFRG